MAVVPAWPAAVVPYWLIMKIDELCSEPMLRRKGNATFSHEKPFIPTKSTMHQSFETLGPPPYWSLTGWSWKLMNCVANPCYGEKEMLPFLTKNLLSQRNLQCTSHLKPLDHHPTPTPPSPTHTHTHTSLLGYDWCIHFYASESMSLGLKWMVNPSCLYMSPHTVLHMSTSGYCDM